MNFENIESCRRLLPNSESTQFNVDHDGSGTAASIACNEGAGNTTIGGI